MNVQPYNGPAIRYNVDFCNQAIFFLMCMRVCMYGLGDCITPVRGQGTGMTHML